MSAAAAIVAAGATFGSTSGFPMSMVSSSSTAGNIGSSGLEDSLFPLAGNGGYDVRNYNLTLDYDPKYRRLKGIVVITAKATQELTRFNLDLTGMTVQGVKVDQAEASFRRDGQELVITPGHPVGHDESFAVTITYEGIPEPIIDSGLPIGWNSTDNGAFVGSQPNAAMTWFPVNDHPKDKASYDFTVTVPKGSTAVANGIFRGQENSDERSTFRWRQEEPMASYLATVAVGEFKIQQYTTETGLEVYNAVDPREAAAWPALEKLPAILDWASGLFGPYPFKSAGAIVVHSDVWGGTSALETQGRPIYPSSLSLDGLSLMVHESAHQWFGDSLTIDTWEDVWLNEGFATYAEWLYDEQHGGDSAQKTFDRFYATPANEPLWNSSVASLRDPSEIFSSGTYTRGAMALHKLRTNVGDDTFFRILRSWTAAHRGGNVTTKQFITLAESLSGKDLVPMFHTWISIQGKPSHP
ncbi:M1 family metallopeptidase [Streptomyces sp. NPDC059355]|uniref:M1 family metallopeptidase n=1 Tax=Streptomyces sp. NPDC059355 TaxID=3346811 RepID=UPI0036BD44FD